MLDTKHYSVLMSVYAKEKTEYLRISLDSMLAQTVRPSEIVLVEDGPLTKELEDTIEQYKNDYPDILNVVVSEKNIGLGAALHLGTDHCSNELIARMDSDDISLATRCEKQLAEFAKNPELDIVGTMCSDFVENPENVISTRIVPTEQKAIYEFAKRRSPFNHISVMFKKSAVQKCGGYSDLRRNQDADLFGKMMFAGCKAYNINEVLVLARMTETRKVRRKQWSNVKGNIDIVHNFWKMGYASFKDYAVVSIAQIMLFLCPVRMQQFVYKKFLRK